MQEGHMMQEVHIVDLLHRALVKVSLCDKYIPKKYIRCYFQPPWFESDCGRLLREKEK